MAWATDSKNSGQQPMTAEADRSWQQADAATLKERARRAWRAPGSYWLQRAFALARPSTGPSATASPA